MPAHGQVLGTSILRPRWIYARMGHCSRASDWAGSSRGRRSARGPSPRAQWPGLGDSQSLPAVQVGSACPAHSAPSQRQAGPAGQMGVSSHREARRCGRGGSDPDSDSPIGSLTQLRHWHRTGKFLTVRVTTQPRPHPGPRPMVRDSPTSSSMQRLPNINVRMQDRAKTTCSDGGDGAEPRTLIFPDGGPSRKFSNSRCQFADTRAGSSQGCPSIGIVHAWCGTVRRGARRDHVTAGMWVRYSRVVFQGFAQPLSRDQWLPG